MVKLSRCTLWGFASLCMASLAIVEAWGLFLYSESLSDRAESFVTLIIVAPISAAIGVAFLFEIAEPMLEWWCSRPKALHKHVVALSATFILATMLGLFAKQPSSNEHA